MKKIFLLSILLVITFIGALLLTSTESSKVNDTERTKQTSETADETVEKLNGITILELKKASKIILIDNSSRLESTENLSIEQNCIGTINAGFFLPDYSHAGLLKLRNIVQKSLAIGGRQLSHIVILDDFISFHKADRIDENTENAFQTGPLLISNSVIEHTLIDASLNGLTFHPRSAIGYSDTNEVFLIISPLPTTLTAFSEDILKSEIAQNKNLHVINLDGGNSVSLFSTLKEAKFGISKKVPYLLCVQR